MNVDDLRKAMKRPELTIDGITITGKLLSWPRWSYWLGRLATWYNGTMTDAEARKDVAAFVTELGLPGEQFVELEAPIVQQGIADFFALHRQVFAAAVAAPSN